MSLAEGTKLGAYEITGGIGAGGMGEVYRATDTKLGRDVAIKTLPAGLADDKDRLARFEREAKLLAALNHPHIASVFSLDEHDGTLYIAMELVEGETLEEKLRKGALAVDDALQLALQIAEALEAAHEKGVIHRDLKPANVMVTGDGIVKVLDFGLAKAFSDDPNQSSADHSPALSLAMTQQGLVLGTAGYMSPEQASGQATDQRADIWSFGVVLYEMLTGLPLFSGESVPHILADVLKTEPDWNRLPENLHPRLKLMLERCLTKRPRNRYHSIADARVDIQAALIDPDGAIGSGVAPMAVAEPPSRRLAFASLMLAIGAVLAAATMLYLQPEPASPRVIRGVHPLPEGATFRGAADRMVTISPDGKRFAYNQSGGLYLRSIDELDARLIPGTEGNLSYPEFSPDGESLMFAQSGQIRRLPIAGGASRGLVATSGTDGISWETDGTFLYAWDNAIFEVSENGGAATRLASVEPGFPLGPQRLPNGDWLLYTRVDNVGSVITSENSEIVLESPSLGERRVLWTGGTHARYLRSGHVVFTYDGVLYAMPFDVESLEGTGAPIPVIQGIRQTIAGQGQFDVSDRGDLVYIPGPVGSSNIDFSVTIADRSGNLMVVGDVSGPFQHIRASGDGQRVAIDSVNEVESYVSIYDLDGQTSLRRLTYGGRDGFPVWSPDDTRIAFQSDREADAGVWVQPVDGASAAVRLTMAEDGTAHVPEAWSPDGQTLLVSVIGDNSQYSLWSVAIDSGEMSRVGNIESREPIGASFSPDGQWIGYHAIASAGEELATSSGIFIQPFPPTGSVNQLPKMERDFQPVWSRDAMQINFIPSTSSQQMVSFNVSDRGGLSFSSPDIFPFTLTAGRLSGATRSFDVLPDGRFIGLTSDADLAGGIPAREIHYVLNWFEELEQLVPTGN